MENDIELRTYEISFLLKDPKDAEIIYDALNKFEAKILTHKEPEKINLAYPIKKNDSAFWGYVYFEMHPENLVNFDKNLKTQQNILRYMIIKDPFIKQQSQPKPQPKQQEIPKKIEVLTNEELSRKIQEMS
jgi:ribosomal protein S6